MQEEMTTLYHLRDAQVVLHRLIPHVRFRVPFLELESQLKSGFACTGRPCCVILQSHFLVPPDGAKNGTTQTFLHAEFIYTKTLLHTVSRQFLHTETYTHTQFFWNLTKVLRRRRFCTQKFWHTKADTQKLLETEAWHTDTFTHKTFCKQSPKGCKRLWASFSAKQLVNVLDLPLWWAATAFSCPRSLQNAAAVFVF